MRNLAEIADRLQEELDEKDTVREIAIKSSRAIIRISSSAIHLIHKGEEVAGLMAEAAEEASRLRGLLGDHPDIMGSGLITDALQEMAEAEILHSIVADKDLPTPEELAVSGPAYLLGLADAVGELRRFALESLRSGDVKRAEEYLEMMEEIFLMLMRFDYPQALVAIKRKQDIARSLLEKTRGEIALAVSSKQLERKMEDLERKL